MFKLDADALAAAKRQVEVETRARQKTAPPNGGQDRSSAWKGAQARRVWGKAAIGSAPQQTNGFRGGAAVAGAGGLKPLTKAQLAPAKGGKH